MNFNKHLNLEGSHAFLSASNYHWINYDDEKLDATYLRSMATQRGTLLHSFAKEAINLRIKQIRNRDTLNMYINDAIGYKMDTEQILYYSDNCFGTADAICFRKNFLRIHDFKSGATPASTKQIEVYAALFCLEYGIKPQDIEMELRLYQDHEIIVCEPAPEDTIYIMEKIIAFDQRIEKLKIGV